jgi:DNA-binding GntR family transcriptional regulator
VAPRAASRKRPVRRRLSASPAVVRAFPGSEVAPKGARKQRSGQQRADFVYTNVHEAISTGRLRPGDRVRESELATWLAVSRTPVRDALRRLESEGLVSHAARRGLVVTEFDAQQVVELYSLREALEGMAASLAARYASESEIRSLQDLIARQKLTTHPMELAELNKQFHALLYHAARNRYLIRALGGLSDSLAMLGDTTYSVPGRRPAALAEHLKIIDALKRQDAVAADAAARRHIRLGANARLTMVVGDTGGAPASRRPRAS